MLKGSWIKDQGVSIICLIYFFSELKAAELKIVMITGDNLLTGLSVSRDSGIIDPGDRVVILDVIHRHDTIHSRLLRN